MNVRKAVDYAELFTAVDRAVSAVLPQMELYREIGRLISERPEKGAAVAVAEHVKNRWPGLRGFSPRNVRRMREFYRAYENAPEIMAEVMEIGWARNVVILEANLSTVEREWYICATRRYGWSKQQLMEKISEHAYDTDAKSSLIEKNDSGRESEHTGLQCGNSERLSPEDGIGFSPSKKISVCLRTLLPFAIDGGSVLRERAGPMITRWRCCRRGARSCFSFGNLLYYGQNIAA